MIAKVIELREIVQTATTEFNKLVKPLNDDIELLENLLGEEITRLDGQAIKSPYGTAYRSTVTSFRVADREAWLNWVFSEDQRSMLTTNVAKDAVKEYAEKHGVPPGLNVTVIYRTNVLKPTA